MPLRFPKHVPANDNNIPLSQRHWLTPEHRAKLVDKLSIRINVQKESQAKLAKELELMANSKKPLIKRILGKIIR